MSLTEILQAGVAAASRALVQRRADGWVNTVAGLGPGTNDRSQAWQHVPSGDIPWDTLAAAFKDDDVVAAGASRVPDAIVGRGFTVTSDELSEAQAEDLNDELTHEEHLDALTVYHRALIWEQLFGGAAILIGAEDGRPVEEPLDEHAVERVHFLLDLDPREVTPQHGALEINPAHYRVTVGRYQRVVHRSRLVLFKGLPLPRRERLARWGWGASRIERAWDAIKQYHASWASANHAMTDSSQAVYKIKGLSDLIIAGQEEVIRARVALTNMMRGIARAIILDKDLEDFSREDSSSMAGMADVLEQRYQRLAQALEIPVTVLIGMSPAGMNATGESDVRLWYDRIAQDRGRYFTPRLARVVDLVLRSSRGPTKGFVPSDWAIDFASLWLETEREDAEVDQLQISALSTAVDKLGVSREAALDRANEILDLPARTTVTVPAVQAATAL
jgi:phage-related protein (TIGR01555 family)